MANYLRRRNPGYSPDHFKSFDEEWSTEKTNEVFFSFARLHLDQLSEAGWVTAGSWALGCISDCDLPRLLNGNPYVLDCSAADQYHLRQIDAFFGKRQDINVGVDRRAAAWEKFQQAERSCEAVNACFRAWMQGRFQFRPAVEGVIHAAQLKISKALAVRFPDGAPALADIPVRFGPGASTKVRKAKACLAVKAGNVPSCSANFHELDEAYRHIGFAETGSGLLVDVSTSVLSFVPKNALVDRAICTEPELNGLYQLGLGDLLADVLRDIGQDIRDQRRNQRAALYASLSGLLATIDLSSASDTVSRQLIWALFPSDWADLFDRLRSAECYYESGGIMQMQKLSSMGNGFTFPVETLVFWAISSAVGDKYKTRYGKKIEVYGDDIIVPSACVGELMSTLTDLGFRVNPSKSFWTGDFRESCGADYVLGINVRPAYFDGPLTGADVFRLHNFYASRGLYYMASLCEQLLHPCIRLRGPKGYGDGHLHCKYWVSQRPARADETGDSTFSFQTWTYKPKMLEWDIARRYLADTPRPGPQWYRRLNRTASERKFIPFQTKAYFRVKRLATYTAYARAQDASNFLGSIRSDGNVSVRYANGRPVLVYGRDLSEWALETDRKSVV